jgi:hypothetical protein
MPMIAMACVRASSPAILIGDVLCLWEHN